MNRLIRNAESILNGVPKTDDREVWIYLYKQYIVYLKTDKKNRLEFDAWIKEI